MKKRILIIFITLLTALSIFVAGCGTYRPAINQGSNTNKPGTTPDPNDPDNPDKPVDPDDPDDTEFTVSLVLGDEPFLPQTTVTVIWEDGINMPVSAKVDRKTGVAKASGLAGEYTVRLTGLDAKYTYDPNKYYASSIDKDKVIEIFEVLKTANTGKDFYSNIITIQKLGSYKVKINSASDMYCFTYVPKENGVYHVESIVSVVTNEVNPRLDIYTGTAGAYATYNRTINDGGTYASYTKNFDYVMELDDSSVRSGFMFGVKADSRVGYPVYVDFVVRYEKPYSNRIDYKNVIPDEFKGVLYEADYNTLYNQMLADTDEEIARRDALLPEGGKLTDEEKQEIKDKAIADFNAVCKVRTPEALNELQNRITAYTSGKRNWAYTVINGVNVYDGRNYKFNEETGYYHVYNSVTNTFGPVLCFIIDSDPPGVQSETGKWFYDGKIPKKIGDKDYTSFITNYYGYFGSYYPVTQEVKEFLQAFAISQGYFLDGNGWLEGRGSDLDGNPVQGYNAAEDDQWLFACCYFN